MKICVLCEKPFPRSRKLSDKQWDEQIYCSRRCSALSVHGRPLLSRIFARVSIDPVTTCWVYGGARDSKGYGLVNLPDAPNQKVHRVVYGLAIAGDIPEGVKILHRCDNPPCCNPFHLFAGSIQDNTDDMRLKGRQRHLVGEDVPNARLTEADVLAIRDDPRLQDEIAKSYGVAQTTISAIKTRKNWSHV